MKGVFGLSKFQEDLFVLDLANNHFGDVAHAKNIIERVANEVGHLKLNIGIKFQYRNLRTFIHPDFHSRRDLKYVDRFLSTELNEDDFAELAQFVRASGFKVISTPFDEDSVKLVRDLNLDFVKVASASSDDYPLLTEVTKLKQPIIASTGGLRIDQIDRLVSILRSSGNEFAVMHCVSIYPSPPETLSLNQIRNLQDRYPGIPIGWSTHENPEDFRPLMLAKAMGARVFERHIGLTTPNYPLNLYSSSPTQIRLWLESYIECSAMLGAKNRLPASDAEIQSLRSLKRGIYLKRDIEIGELIKEDDVFLAIPAQDDGVLSGEVSFPVRSNENLKKNEIFPKSVALAVDSQSDESIINSIIHQVRGLLNDSKTAINSNLSLEISHHFGLARFREFGCCMFTCINTEYAKKILVLLPRQKHPMHFHKRKTETFQLLWGDLELEINGNRNAMALGDILTVEVGDWHKFQTLNGAVIEEISTHHYPDDSFYEDQQIKNLAPAARKSIVPNWGNQLQMIDRGK